MRRDRLSADTRSLLAISVSDRARRRVAAVPVSLALAGDADRRQLLAELLDSSSLFEGLTWPDA